MYVQRSSECPKANSKSLGEESCAEKKNVFIKPSAI